MPDIKKQYRTVAVKKVNFRAATAETPATISGYASVFNTLSEPLGEYCGGREMIAPGAFTGVLPTADVRLLINHDCNLVLARNTSGTLTLTQDDTGLFFEATLGNQTYAKDLAETMARGDITGCSFAFCIQDADSQMVSGEPVVVIRSVTDLTDVSIVTYPAYTAATAEVRSKNTLVFGDSRSVVDEAHTKPATLAHQQRLLQLMELE